MDSLEKLLNSVSKEKREPLVKMMDTVYCESSDPKQIISGIRWLNRNIFEDFYRDVFGKPESYKDILRSICSHLKLQVKPFYAVDDMERMICQKVMETVWDKLTPQQRVELDEELGKIAESYGKSNEWIKAGGLSGAIVAGELGGMTTYIMATSALSALSGLFGITLPFVVYTSLTRAMSIVLGPIGWISSGLYAVWKISGPNFKKLIPVALYISALRYESKIL